MKLLDIDAAVPHVLRIDILCCRVSSRDWALPTPQVLMSGDVIAHRFPHSREGSGGITD
ncbi:hypothetical protein [Pacificibacter marinus]|uniref:hypothetical protein n=1 Tax=Pacificibacter marinus TaxID=658057 RepID=UPI00147EBFBF|nr:hypothetical protein [Pacificibacter marinus]